MRFKTITVLSLVLVLLTGFSLVVCACPTPALDSVSPDRGANDESIQIAIKGAKFHKSVGVKLVKAGEAEIIATDVKLISENEVTCTLDLKGKAAGKWDLIVYNVGAITKKEKLAAPPAVFTIFEKAPVVSSIIPKMGLKNSVVPVSVNGAHFRNGAKVALGAQGLPDLKVANIKVVSDTQIICELDLNGATPGIYDVTVTNPDGQSGALYQSFAVDSQAPIVKMIVPNRGTNDGPITLILTGENFEQKATAKLSKSGKEIIGADTKVASGSELSGIFDLNQKEAGTYDVVVTNPDGKSGVLTDAFTIDAFTIEKIMEQKLLKSIFFDFDKSDIRPDQESRLNYNFDLLKDFKDYYIVLDGHADERGAREYNIALAGRRADTVKKALIDQGFDPDKITINAYGEDYPVKKGHDESSWWYNRRVDISIWETDPANWANRSQSVYFKKKSAELDAAQLERIEQSAAILKESPGSFIILVANTKDFSSGQENLKLANERLDAVKACLVAQGIGEDRISAIDNGKVYPFFSDLTDTNVSIDSRVDLLVIQF